jgi:hypothetical protein
MPKRVSANSGIIAGLPPNIRAGGFWDRRTPLHAGPAGSCHALLETSIRDPVKVVSLYATIGKLRLFASEKTVEAADKVMSRILETYYGPRIDLQTKPTPSHTPDILREFSERCRAELSAYDH